MPISATPPRIQYVADGQQTEFPFPFTLLQAADIQVFLDDVLQTDGYSVTGPDALAAGSVSFPSPPPSGARVTLRRYLGLSRTTDFQDSGVIRASVLNGELDYLIAGLQQLQSDVARTVQLSATDESAALILPPRTTRAGRTLGFDANGDLIVTADGSGGSISLEGLTLDNISEGVSAKHFRAIDQSKLSGIEPGAQVNTVTSALGLTGAVSVASLAEETAIDAATDMVLVFDSSANAHRKVRLANLTGGAAGGATGALDGGAANSTYLDIADGGSA